MLLMMSKERLSHIRHCSIPLLTMGPTGGEPPWSWGPTLSTSVLGGGLCLFLARKKLEGLNDIIKSIFYAMGLEMIVGHFIELVFYVLWRVFEINNFGVCFALR